MMFQRPIDRPPPRDWLQFVCGLCIGAVDIVPGVSGGTVALVLNIYERLVTAISHIDTRLFSLLRQGKWREADDHADVRFLAGVGTGMACGMFTVGLLVNWLLKDAGAFARSTTLAAFFGAVVASSWIVAQLIHPRGRRDVVISIVLVLLGAAFAYWFTSLSWVQPTSNPHLGYLFVCGFTAICAMILPGISGAYLLLILGVYEYLTGIIHAVPAGELTPRHALDVLVFGIGCALGITSFSRVLRWLLSRYHRPVVAILTGFMIGGLRAIWPFEARAGGTDEHPRFEPIVPEAFDATVAAALAAAVAAAIVVLAVDRAMRLKTR